MRRCLACDKSGLEITVDNGELTIVGHRQIERPSGEPIHREIRHYDFRRVYELDPAIDSTRIAARFDQGVLTLTLPKAESVKPRKIRWTERQQSRHIEKWLHSFLSYSWLVASSETPCRG